MFIQIFTRTREMYISHSRRENIPCRVGRRRRGRRGERRTDLTRRWSALDSLGTKRSWNVLWKLLWKALRGTDRTGAPGSRFCYTRAATTMRRPPSFPLKPAGPYMLRSRPSSSLSFPLCANKSRLSLSILDSASLFTIVISVFWYFAHRSRPSRFFSSRFFLVCFILLRLHG